jgi:hypothetical protein
VHEDVLCQGKDIREAPFLYRPVVVAEGLNQSRYLTGIGDLGSDLSNFVD